METKEQLAKWRMNSAGGLSHSFHQDEGDGFSSRRRWFLQQRGKGLYRQPLSEVWRRMELQRFLQTQRNSATVLGLASIYSVAQLERNNWKMIWKTRRGEGFL
jgi:hypothetical protein